MAKYGNILTVFNLDDNTKENIKTILTGHSAFFENIDNVFFIKSNSKRNTGDIVNAITALNIEHIFYHINIVDGSIIYHNEKDIELDTTTVNRVIDLLFE